MTIRYILLTNAIDRVRNRIRDLFGTAVELKVVAGHMANMRPERHPGMSNSPFRVHSLHVQKTTNQSSARCTVALQEIQNKRADSVVMQIVIDEIAVGLGVDSDRVEVTDLGVHIHDKHIEGTRSICGLIEHRCRERGVNPEVSPVLHIQITANNDRSFGVIGLAADDVRASHLNDGRAIRGL